MGDKTTDLALKTFGGGKSEPDDHQERHDYYKQLCAKEKAGKPLSSTETTWLAQARKTARPAAKSVDVDGMALKEFSKPRKLDIEIGKPVMDRDIVIGKPVMDRDITIGKPQMDGSIDAKTKYLDPRTPGGAGLQALDALLRAKDPAQNTVADGMMRGMYRASHEPQLIPNAPVGQPLARDLLRRPSDVIVDKQRYQDRDAFGIDSMEELYGKHLKAAEDNYSYENDYDGKDEFPEGYFKDVPKAEEQKIRNGVRALRELHSGTRT